MEPTTYQRPRLRYWLPGAKIDESTLCSQLRAVKEAGWGGVEIAWLGPTVEERENIRDYRFGSELWKSRFEFLVEEAATLDLHLDFTISASWPCQIPGILPSEPETAVELVCGVHLIQDQVYAGDLPLPISAPSGQSPAFHDVESPLTVVGVHVALVSLGEETPDSSGPWTLAKEASEAIKNVDHVDGRVKYRSERTVEPGMAELLVVTYARSTCQHKSIWEKHNDLVYLEPRGTVVDHFDGKGVDAVKHFYQDIFTPKLLANLQKMKSSVFEDSLELHHAQFWTSTFRDSFLEFRGYSCDQYLPLLHEKYRPMAFSPHISVVLPAEGANGETARRFMYDFKRTLSDLYLSQRLERIVDWTRANGLNFRCQPYELDIDVGLAASIVDIPEGETLTFRGNRDAFRLLATGRNVQGRQILSDELAACMFEAYEFSWKRVIQMASLDFALGVNQIVLHGIPFAHAPKSTWPGYYPFLPAPPLPSFSDAWDPRQPQWEFSRQCTDYLARTQAILQSGIAHTDIAIFHPALKGIDVEWSDTTLTGRGYTYGFLTDGLLAHPNATVTERRLSPKGPAFKCLVINETAMQVDTTQRILQLAKDGLPIVIIDPLPIVALGLGKDTSALDKEVETVFKEIIKLPGCHHLSGVGELVDVLGRAGIAPSIEYEGEGNWLHSHRIHEDTSWIYLFNDSSERQERVVYLDQYGANIQQYSAWTGVTSPVTRISGQRGLGSRVSLSPAEAILLRDEPNIVKEASDASDSETLLDDWSLQVEAWSPADTRATGKAALETRKTILGPYSLKSLVAWNTIPDLVGKAGIGTYKTTFSLSPKLTSAHLVFSLHQDTVMRVKVNGELVVGDCVGIGPLDITGAARVGIINDIEIAIGTSLINQMRVLDPDGFGKRPDKEYGLRGVRLLVK